MLMVSYTLTELVDAIRNDNPGVKMPYVVDIYYNKEAKYPELSTLIEYGGREVYDEFGR